VCRRGSTESRLPPENATRPLPKRCVCSRVWAFTAAGSIAYPWSVCILLTCSFTGTEVAAVDVSSLHVCGVCPLLPVAFAFLCDRKRAGDREGAGEEGGAGEGAGEGEGAGAGEEEGACS